MSYDIDLLDPVTEEIIELDAAHQMRGGTYVRGGTSLASLNVTYNYSEFFYNVIDSDEGIRFIYGKSGADSIPILKNAISKLKDDVDSNYWIPTEGNAKQALVKLLAIAQMRPDGIWDGD